MNKKIISGGVAHELPLDLKKTIFGTLGLLELWEKITPLARNEWICFILSAKKQETRIRRIERLCNDLKKGKNRPCCWAGCPHRN